MTSSSTSASTGITSAGTAPASLERPIDPALATTARAYFDARDAEAPDHLAATTMMRIVLDSGRGYVLQASEHGVLMKLVRGNQYLMDATDDQQAARLAALCTGPERVVSLADTRHVPLFNVAEQDIFRCATYVYAGEPKPASLPDAQGRTTIGGLQLRRLDESFLDQICEHYHVVPRPLIAEHLRDGLMYGGFDANDQLTSFIGEHTEGSIGLLVVLPEHRRHGYAQALESLMINLHLSKGRMPYCQVALDNEASHALQAKLSFTRLPGEQCWIDA